MTEKQTQETPLEPQLAIELRRLKDTGIEPPKDLWPMLESDLRGRTRPAHSTAGYYALAAAVLLAVSAGVVWWQLRTPSERDTLSLDSRAALAISPSTSQGLQVTHARYVTQRAETLRTISAALEDYPASLREEIRTSLEEIERAMIEIERSIEQRQGAPERELRLAELYQLELGLLTVVSDRLTGATMSGGAS